MRSARFEWAHYLHLLPEYVYDVSMRYWKYIRLTSYCVPEKSSHIQNKSNEDSLSF